MAGVAAEKGRARPELESQSGNDPALGVVAEARLDREAEVAAPPPR
jgi:hypothetical protein